MANPMVVERCVLNPGDLVANKYTVVKTLGEGSFGAVCVVKDMQGNVFALKILRLWDVPAEIRKPLIDRFEMEFKTGQIESEYLVHSLDYGILGGNPYILMELCPGGDLSPWLGRDYTKAVRVCQQILLGLNDLHSCGKVHRDLKPENVLFKKNGVAALTDFGIAGDRNKRMTERNIFGKPNQMFGTYAYMPPEQVNRARGEATVLPTTDIFSFGVLAFQLLTGELPFGPLTSHNELAQYQKNAKEGIWHRSALNGLPDAQQWMTVIEGCLVPNFKHRFPDVKTVLAHLPGPPVSAPVQQKPPQQQQSRGTILRIMQGEEYGKEYLIDSIAANGRRLLRMGRDADNDLHILETQSTYISRHHCTLELAPDNKSWIVRDGQWNNAEQNWKPSSNGTYVGSAQVTPAGYYLAPGDILSIGDTKLRVEA